MDTNEPDPLVELLHAPGDFHWRRWLLHPIMTHRIIDALRHVRDAGPVIRSFADRDTERVWRRESVPRLDTRIHRAANRKLRMLDAAVTLDALRVPPGNRLEALKGDRKGRHSIRVNDQWRITFRWTDAGPEDVLIEDYH